MYKINDFVVYKMKVCRVSNIKKYNDEAYYTIIPIDDESLKIDIPASNKLNNLGSLITPDEVYKIIDDIPSIAVIENNDKYIEAEYKTLIHTGKHSDLVKVIKTTYLRNKEKRDNNKKIGEIDNDYFNLAERYLYNEFSCVLNMDFDDTKNFVINKVHELTK